MFETQRLVMLVAFHLIFGMYCLRAIVGYRRFDLLGSLAMAITATLLCIADSRILRKPMTHAAQWVMLFIWPVAVPTYLVWSRGWRGLLVLGLHGFLLTATFIVVLVTGGIALLLTR